MSRLCRSRGAQTTSSKLFVLPHKREREDRTSRLRSARKLELPRATLNASLVTQLGRARGCAIQPQKLPSVHEARPGQCANTARLQSGAHSHSPPRPGCEGWTSDVEWA